MPWARAACEERRSSAYLQIRLFDGLNGGFGACELPEAPAREVQASIDHTALGEVAEAAGFGPLVLSQLFVAPRR